MSALAKFALGIAGSAALCVFLYCWWKKGLVSPETAAWAQGIGTVAAIVVAVWLQDRDRRVRKRDELERYTGLVVAALKHAASTARITANTLIADEELTRKDAPWLINGLRTASAALLNLNHSAGSGLVLRQVLGCVADIQFIIGILERAGPAGEPLRDPGGIGIAAHEMEGYADDAAKLLHDLAHLR